MKRGTRVAHILRHARERYGRVVKHPRHGLLRRPGQDVIVRYDDTGRIERVSAPLLLER